MATPERYQKLDKIGEGSCGVVFRCRCRQTGSIVAIKKVRYSYDAGPSAGCGDPFGASAQVLREVALLKSIGEHSAVAPLLDAFAEPGKLYMVFEHFDGDLARHLQEAGALPAPKLKRYAFQLLNGLTHCHTRRVAHRDLKPQNLLLKRETDELKLCDFSLSRAFVIHPSSCSKPETQTVASLWYRGPEVFLRAPTIGVLLDVWSAGCVLAEMAKGKAIFQASSEIGMLFNIFFQLGTPSEASWPGVSSHSAWSDQFPQFPARSFRHLLPDAGGQNLLASMLCCNPFSRQPMRRLCQHPFFWHLDQSVPAMPNCNWVDATDRLQSRKQRSSDDSICPAPDPNADGSFSRFFGEESSQKRFRQDQPHGLGMQRHAAVDDEFMHAQKQFLRR